MAAALSSLCLGLPPPAARQVFDFVFHPAGYLHADRSRLHIPAPLHGVGMSDHLVSSCLLSSLGLNEDVDLDLHDRAHRAALLPASVLENLALRLALSQQSPRMKQVILRSELELLQKQLTPADWDFIFKQQPSHANTDEPQLLDSVPVADWPARLTKWGWRTLESACSVLPQSVGKRLLLKLPIVSGPQYLSPELACARMRSIYPALVGQWNAQWDADWQTAASSSP